MPIDVVKTLNLVSMRPITAADDAAVAAKDYIAHAIESGAAYEIGHGHGPVDHFWMLGR